MKRGKVLFLLLPAIFLFLLPKPSLAAVGGTATFEVQKDTYANLAYPDKVNGSFGSVTLSNKHTTRLGYLWFQDIDLPEGATINKAALKIYVHEQNYADHAKLNVGPVTSDWRRGVNASNTAAGIKMPQVMSSAQPGGVCRIDQVTRMTVRAAIQRKREARRAIS